ncbi:hypothetical protein ACF3NX_06275 [Acetobacter orientalis]|uniref:hypothetical protein n=1 Tax=Acetobacter orientalis TaxID=146474 RepID=UPI00386BC92F
MDDLHNPAPILDMVAVRKQIVDNQKTFAQIGVGASPKKIIEQITPQKIQLPYCGVSVECGDISANPANTTTVQVMEVVVSCTCVFQASDDFTGAGQQINFMDNGLKDLFHCLYNWQPSKKRYLNGFRLLRFERLDDLSNNSYEIYMVYFIIPLQIDFLDGFMDEQARLREIQSQLILKKDKDIQTLQIRNVNKYQGL